MSTPPKTLLPRRRLLGLGAGLVSLPLSSLPLAGASLAAPFLAKSAAAKGLRQLDLVNMNTGERLRADFWHDGGFDDDVLDAVAKLLRDHHNGKVHAIDPQLLSGLYALLNGLGWPGEVRIISAYRSPATNAELGKEGIPVAKNSFHIKGKALDFRIAGLDFQRLVKAAVSHHKGGIGIYKGRRFLHLDSGPRRIWRG